MFYSYRESNLKQLATLEISDGMEPKAIFGKNLVKKIILVKSRFFLRPQNSFEQRNMGCQFDISSASNVHSRFGTSRFGFPNVENSKFKNSTFGLPNIDKSIYCLPNFKTSRFGVVNIEN